MDTFSRVILALLVAVFAWAYVRPAFASGTVAITPSYTQYTWQYRANACVGGNCGNGPYPKAWMASVSAACSSAFSSDITVVSCPPPVTTQATASSTATMANAQGSWTTYSYYASISASTVGGTVPATCPANSTGTTSCTCNAGFIPNAGATACVGVCSTTLGQSLTGEITVPVTGQFTPTSACYGGCSYGKTFDTGGAWGKLAGAWTWWGNGADFVGNGSTCSPPSGPAGPTDPIPVPPSPSPSAPPRGMCPGTVNGVSVNMPCDGTSAGSGGPLAPPPPGTSASGVGGGPLPQGAGSLSGPTKSPAPTGTKPGDKGSATTCTGELCNTTDCMVVIQLDGTWQKECTTSGTDKGTFCKNNPGDASCKSVQSSFVGPCGSPPVCTGDAIQCAMAKDQIARNCQTLEAAPSTDPAVIAAGAGIHPSDHPWSTGTSTAISFDQTNILSGSCPGDATYALAAGRTIVIPFSKMCTPATWLGNILVALTAFSCLGIVFIRRA